MTEYCIVSAEAPHILENRVHLRIDDGWLPLGGALVGTTNFYQAMTIDRTPLRVGPIVPTKDGEYRLPRDQELQAFCGYLWDKGVLLGACNQGPSPQKRIDALIAEYLWGRKHHKD